MFLFAKGVGPGMNFIISCADARPTRFCELGSDNGVFIQIVPSADVSLLLSSTGCSSSSLSSPESSELSLCSENYESSK